MSERDPYFVEVEDNGCGHCGAGRMWTIMGPDGADIGQSWGVDSEGECPTDAEELCEALNDAYARGLRDGAPDVAAMVNRFLGWKLPTDFGPDCGITFKPIQHPHSWPVGTNLLTADQARDMLMFVLAIGTKP